MPGILTRAVRELLSPAMVVALLALALSLGGTAYAAKLITSKEIKNNTVKSVDIRNGGVAAVDIKKGAIGSAELKDGGVGSADIADGGVGSAEIADGAVGSADVADGSIGLDDLSPAVKAAISQTWDRARRSCRGGP